MISIVVSVALMAVGGVVAVVSGAAAYFVACGHLHTLNNVLDLAFWLQLAALGGTVALAGIVQLVT